MTTGALSFRSGYTTNDLIGAPVLALISTHSPWRGDDFSCAVAWAFLSGPGRSPVGGRFGLRGACAAGAACASIAWPACGSAARSAAVCANAGVLAKINAAARLNRFIAPPDFHIP